MRGAAIELHGGIDRTAYGMDVPKIPCVAMWRAEASVAIIVWVEVPSHCHAFVHSIAKLVNVKSVRAILQRRQPRVDCDGEFELRLEEFDVAAQFLLLVVQQRDGSCGHVCHVRWKKGNQN